MHGSCLQTWKIRNDYLSGISQSTIAMFLRNKSEMMESVKGPASVKAVRLNEVPMDLY